MCDHPYCCAYVCGILFRNQYVGFQDPRDVSLQTLPAGELPDVSKYFASNARSSSHDVGLQVSDNTMT